MLDLDMQMKNSPRHICKQFDLSIFDNKLLNYDLCSISVTNYPSISHEVTKQLELIFFLLIFGIHHFVNVYSRFTWVFPIQTKSKCFTKSKESKINVKNQLNMTIKAIQTDNGGEFKNKKFRDYLLENEINHRFACPHTHEPVGQHFQSQKWRSRYNTGSTRTGFEHNLPLVDR